MTANVVDALMDWGRKAMLGAQQVIRQGQEVLPVAVLCDAGGKITLAPLVGIRNADERAQLIRELVQKTHAVAVGIFSDAYIRDPVTNERIGEQLTLTVQTSNDDGVGLACRYTRDPLVFGAIETFDRSAFIRDLFPPTRPPA